MAIAFDAVSSGETTGSTLTVSHTCTGTDMALFVWVANFRIAGNAAVLTATYNGSAMTSIGTVQRGAVNNSRLTLFGIKAPTTGANDIAVTETTANDEIVLVAASYTGVDQTTPWDGVQTHDQEADPPNVTTTVSSAVGDLVAGGIDFFDSTPTVGAGQTERVYNNNTNAFESMAISDEPGAASVTHTYAITGTNSARMISVNINAAAGGGGDPESNLIGGKLLDGGLLIGGGNLLGRGG
jgi:hypothetical protein